jgi:nitroreductase
MTLSQTTELIRQRRSVKPVDMDPEQHIPRELLVELIENATWAPNHGLTEPWKFVIFQGQQRHILAQQMQSVYTATTPAAEFRQDKAEKMSRNPLCAHTVIAACMLRKGGDKIPAVEELEALACGIQNLMLSATAAGVGSYWSSPPLLGTQAWTQWLGLKSEDRCVGLIYLGYAKATSAKPKSTRSPVEQCMQWWADGEA